MNYVNKISEKDNKKVRTSLLVISAIVVFFLGTSTCVKALSTSSSVNSNMFYVQIINYTMPLLKVTTFDPDDMAENTFSIKSKVMQFLGIDTSSPALIIGREVSFFSGNNTSYAANVSEINPFKLSDNNISKATDIDSTDNTIVNDPSLKKTLNIDKPDVLIYHSHTTEAYAPFGTDSFNDSQNVCAPGDALADYLEKDYGISVLHDKVVHNANAYLLSYERSGEVLDQYLKKYGDFKMIIDMHRDSDPVKSDVTVKINNENAAKCMFVMATGNPHYSKNAAIVNGLIGLSDKLFKGLINDKIYTYNVGTRYFNQDKSNNAFLLEVGSNVNTVAETKTSMKYFARLIAEYLNKK